MIFCLSSSKTHGKIYLKEYKYLENVNPKGENYILVHILRTLGRSGVWGIALFQQAWFRTCIPLTLIRYVIFLRFQAAYSPNHQI